MSGYSLESPHRGNSNEYPQHTGEAILMSTHNDSNEYSQHTSEAILMSTHNVCFYAEICKIILYHKIPSLSVPLISPQGGDISHSIDEHELDVYYSLSLSGR